MILRSSIYSGIAYPNPKNLGQTGAIVMKLLYDYLDKGFTVYMLTTFITQFGLLKN